MASVTTIVVVTDFPLGRLAPEQSGINPEHVAKVDPFPARIAAIVEQRVEREPTLVECVECEHLNTLHFALTGAHSAAENTDRMHGD